MLHVYNCGSLEVHGLDRQILAVVVNCVRHFSRMASSPADSDSGSARKLKRKTGLEGGVGVTGSPSESEFDEPKIEAPPVKKSKAVRRLFSDFEAADSKKCRKLSGVTPTKQDSTEEEEDSGVTDGDSPPSPARLRNHGRRGCKHDSVNGMEEHANPLSSSDEGLSDSSNEPEAAGIGKLREIYSTAHKLYLSKKISAENAFQLEFVSYMLQILTLDEFKQRNLVGKASVIEIGAKIHECRVERVRQSVSKLAAEVTSNIVVEETPGSADQSTSVQVVAQPRGTKNRKRSRFIVDDEAKISTGFEDQEIKHLHRRNTLKHVFFKNIDEEIEFDYLRFFIKNEEPHPLERPAESLALGSGACFPDSNGVPVKEDIKGTKWLPFQLVERWDPETFDIWGLPLNSDEEASCAESMAPGPQMIGTSVTDHNVATVDVRSNLGNEEDRLELNTRTDYLSQSSDEEGHDPSGIAERGSNDEIPSRRPHVAIEEVKSLDYMKCVFEKWGQWKGCLSSRYGWLGPHFCHELSSVKRKHNSKRRAGTAKFINLRSIDFRDPRNAYKAVSPEKTQLSCETLLKWKSANTNLEKILSRRYSPTIDFEDPYEPTELIRPPSLLTFFTDSNRCMLSASTYDEKPTAVDDDDEPTQLLNISQELSFEMEFNDCREFQRRHDEETMENLGDMHQAEVEAQPCDYVAENRLAEGFDYHQFFTGFHMNQQDAPEEELDLPEIRLRYAMKPRPVNIHALKSAIHDFLQVELHLAEKADNISIGDTTTSLRTLVKEVMARLDTKSRENISLHLVVVALLHVIAEHKLFMIPFQDENPLIVSRSKTWVHKENIPGLSSL